MPKTETLFFDAKGKRVDAKDAVRAERHTYSEEGTLLLREYFVAEPKPESRQKHLAGAHDESTHGNRFSSAVSVKEATEYAEKKFGIKVFYGRNLELANKVNEALFELNKRGVPLPKEIIADSKIFRERFKRVRQGKYVPGMFAFSESNPPQYQPVVFFNPKADFWKNPEEDSKREFESGWWTSSHPLHPIFHEIGHANHYASDRAKFKSAIYGGRIPDSIRVEIGKEIGGGRRAYAFTNKAEFVAEIFAGVGAGRKFSPRVIELYKEYGGFFRGMKPTEPSVTEPSAPPTSVPIITRQEDFDPELLEEFAKPVTREDVEAARRRTIAEAEDESEQRKQTGTFVLQRRFWRVREIVREGPTKQFWHLRMDLGGRFAPALLLEGDPLASKTVPGTYDPKASRIMLQRTGTFAAAEIDDPKPEKVGEVTIEELDRGSLQLEEDGPEKKIIKLAGQKLSGRFAVQDEGGGIWSLTRLG
jgi:hypothetical protein